MKLPAYCATVLIGILLFATSTDAPASDAGQSGIELLARTSCAAGPTIVFENGARETFDSWSKVIASIDQETSIFAYNRPGYGNSAPTTRSRDGRTIVDELRNTLRSSGLRPPYILVGHSLGGLYMQLFARAYPQEVQGLVLVDSLWPGIVKKTEDFPWTTRIAKRLFLSSTINQEIDQIHTTGDQVLALSWHNRIPVERLINAPKSAGAVGVDFGAFNSGPAVKAMIDGLYPNANTSIVDSDHRMQVASPDIVVSAIRRVMPKRNPGGC